MSRHPQGRARRDGRRRSRRSGSVRASRRGGRRQSNRWRRRWRNCSSGSRRGGDGDANRRTGRRNGSLRRACGGTGGQSGRFGEQFQLDTSQLQPLPRQQEGFLDRSAVEERTIGGAEVAQRDILTGHDELAVCAGNRVVLNVDIASRAASDRVRAGFQDSFPLIRRTRIDGEPRHGQTKQ